jgi:hypothetical protein
MEDEIKAEAGGEFAVVTISPTIWVVGWLRLFQKHWSGSLQKVAAFWIISSEPSKHSAAHHSETVQQCWHSGGEVKRAPLQKVKLDHFCWRSLCKERDSGLITHLVLFGKIVWCSNDPGDMNCESPAFPCTL